MLDIVPADLDRFALSKFNDTGGVGDPFRTRS
jgi:hypothetical protein